MYTVKVILWRVRWTLLVIHLFLFDMLLFTLFLFSLGVWWKKESLYKYAALTPFLSLCVQPGSEGTAVPFVCCSGEAATGEAGAGGAQEAEAGRGAGEGGHILPFIFLSLYSFPLLRTQRTFSDKLFHSHRTGHGRLYPPVLVICFLFWCSSLYFCFSVSFPLHINRTGYI